MLDYPQLAVGDSYLYITLQLVSVLPSGEPGVTGAAILRMPLSDLVDMGSHTAKFDYSVSNTSANFGMARNCGDCAIFASHEQKTNVLRVYQCPENQSKFSWQDFAIPEWNNVDYQSLTPAGDDWMDSSWARISGARADSGSVVFAWNAGRDPESPHPWIYVIHIIPHNPNTQGPGVGGVVVGISQIWSTEFAYGFPAVGSIPTAGPNGPIALCCGWGGGKKYNANFAVGFLDLPLSGASYISHAVCKSTASAPRWGDFINVANRYDFAAVFTTAGYAVESKPDGAQSTSYYVEFMPIPSPISHPPIKESLRDWQLINP